MHTTPNTGGRILERTQGSGLWSGVIAGFFISLLSFWILSSLGMALGGHSLAWLSMGALDGIGIGAGIWLLSSAIIACFLGGYFCSRIVSYSSWKAGVTEGLVVSSTFFLFLVAQSAMGLAFLGQGVAQTAALAGGASGQLISRAEVQAVLGHSLDGLELRASPEVVINRVGYALLRGDTEAAKRYLASQSNLSRAQIDSQVQEISAGLDRTANQVKEAAGSAMATLGWFSFFTLLLSTVGACVGATVGARKNETAPLLSMWSAPRVDRAA
ncbi:MAG: hypothetical protein EA369_09780 [Bradymonadales bacterium]|nr:MAG: hypothetical protein EA369_09780 [Bradymonadales bacterium]